MSKVIHLSDEAHSKAKAHCRDHGLKMSDWVAGLIDAAMAMAMAGGQQAASAADDNVRALVQKKKVLEQFDEKPPSADDGVPAYAAPPFWANANGH